MILPFTPRQTLIPRQTCEGGRLFTRAAEKSLIHQSDISGITKSRAQSEPRDLEALCKQSKVNKENMLVIKFIYYLLCLADKRIQSPKKQKKSFYP